MDESEAPGAGLEPAPKTGSKRNHTEPGDVRRPGEGLENKAHGPDGASAARTVKREGTVDLEGLPTPSVSPESQANASAEARCSEPCSKARLEQLNDLARKVWPDACVIEDGEAVVVFGSVQREQGRAFITEHARFNPHPKALDSLEAALLALAGEPPQWAAELARKWRRSLELGVECDAAGTAHAEAVRACAHELLAAARGAR